MNVIKLVLLAGTAASCPLGSAGNRDIMEPDMANVEEEMEGFRKSRMAIVRYNVLLELCCRIVSLELKEHPRLPDGKIKYRKMCDLIPQSILAQCPADFRQSYVEVLEGIEKNLSDNISWGGTPEGKEMFSRLEEARKRFSDQYDLEPLMRPLIDWLDGQETRREGESPQEYLKRLYQLKSDLESGKWVIPEGLPGEKPGPECMKSVAGQ